MREVTVPVLPPGSRDLRVLHVSDLHLTPSQRDKVAFVRSLAQTDPHVVINTGDNLAHRDALRPALEAFAPLLGLPGAFAMGSNDFFGPVPKNPLRYLLPDARRDTGSHDVPDLPGAELRDAFIAAGWHDLGNRRAVIDVGRTRVSLVGTADAHLDLDDVPPATRREKPQGAALHLGVTHAPYRRVLDALQGDGCDLVLAGHTHGGQVCVPGHGALTTNCDLDNGRAKGLHGYPGERPDQDPRSMWLHVSAGLGTSPYAPVRLACRPEATLLTLVGR